MTRKEMLSFTAEDINSMNKEELLQLAKAEQKAIKDARYRLKNAGMETSASRQLSDAGNISAKKSMTRNELMREVAKGRTILNYKTLQVSDARKVEQEMLSTFQSEIARNPTKHEMKAVWQIIDKIRDSNPALTTVGGTNPHTSIKQAVYDVVHENKKGNRAIGKKQLEYLRTLAEEKLSNLYEERQYKHEAELYEFDEDEEDFPF